MTVIFHDYLQKIVECYVDDIAVKRRSKEEHIRGLRIIFDVMRAQQLKMNPIKSFIGVSRKISQFRGNNKTYSIRPLKNKGNTRYMISEKYKRTTRFVRMTNIHPSFHYQFSRKISTFSRLIKKSIYFAWNVECQRDFDDIKQYLINSLVLTVLVSSKPFVLTIRAMDHILGALLS